MILIDISGASAVIRKQEVLTQGMAGATVTFRFDSSWDGFSKTAVFRGGDITKDVVNIADTVIIPWEVLQAGLPVDIGVYGIKGKVSLPTVWARTNPVQPGADPSGDESADPTLPVWEQARQDAEFVREAMKNLNQSVKERTKDGAKQVYTDNTTDHTNRASLIVDEHGNIVLEPLNERDGVATDADGNPIKSKLSGVNNFVKGRGNKVDTTAEDTDTAKHGGAVVMGDLNTVTKPLSTTFGYENTNDGGGAAFICGSKNTVSGFGAYAEGGNNTVTGNFAHAENDSNEASGRASHVGGVGSVASHENTFAHGYHLQTGADNQFVVGKNNAVSASALFIVGNGSATNSRANAFLVDANGDTYCGGKLTDRVYGRTLARYRYSETSPGASDKIPSSCNAPGVVGEFVAGVAAGYLYICVADNSWVRVPLANSQTWNGVTAITDDERVATKAQIKAYVDEAILGGAW